MLHLLNTLNPRARRLPLLHRILAEAEETSSFPRLEECRDLAEAQSYWVTLHYLLHTLVGWSDVGKGLNNWYAAGQPTHGDLRLKLMKEIWDSEGQLDFFTAHFWRPQTESFGIPDLLSPTEVGKTCHYGDEDWWRQFKRKGSPYPHDPFYGGSNPLHLDDDNYFGDSPSEVEPNGYLHKTKRFRATLIVSSFSSWRYELYKFGLSLPANDHHSWHVEVFDKQVGYLGLFRQSRITKQWFQGSHSVHMMGNG